jgi:hypothetical protein
VNLEKKSHPLLAASSFATCARMARKSDGEEDLTLFLLDMMYA